MILGPGNHRRWASRQAHGTMQPTLTYKLAMAAAQDAGDRSMRAAGRTVWSELDYAAAVRMFTRLCPPPR